MGNHNVFVVFYDAFFETRESAILSFITHEILMSQRSFKKLDIDKTLISRITIDELRIEILEKLKVPPTLPNAH